jgi:restriction system protein
MSYRDLKSFQTSEIIYDFTVDFCKLYVDYKSRTKDQMEQAGRSGMQNIAEPSKNPTSTKSELKLLGVARGSLEELLNDYLAYLRQNNLSLWDKDSPQAKAVRALAYQSNKSYQSYKSYLSNPTDATNAAICLINQCNFLLDRQIKSLKEKFIKHGGFTENLRRQREEERKKQAWRNFYNGLN